MYMNNFRRISASVLAGVMLLSASGFAWSLGYGRPTNKAVLGDTLQLTVPLRLEPGEEIANECLAADVYFGEEKISSQSVRATVLPGTGAERMLKVSTTTLVSEPVVTIYLAAGCKARVTRKFVAFADPPNVNVPSTGEAGSGYVAEAADAAEPVPTNPFMASAPPPVAPALASLKSGKAAKADARKPGGSADTKVASKAPEAQTPRKAPSAVALARSARVQATPDGKPAAAASAKRELKADKSLSLAAKPAVKPEPIARLELDQPDIVATDDLSLRMTPAMGAMPDVDDKAPEVAARRKAASAMWAALNASPEERLKDRQRLLDLEQRLAQVQDEGKQAKAQLAAMQARAEQAESSSGRWTWLLAAVALGAVGLAAYLGRQVSRQKQEAEAWWQSQSELAAPSSLAADSLQADEPEWGPAKVAKANASEPKPAAEPQTPAYKDEPRPAAVARPVSASALPAGSKEPESPAKSAAQDEAWKVNTMPMPTAPVASAPVGVVANEPLREVSVEELIDLEQQAEFFIVLGQDDAAINLLEGHVHHTTGASPLPFLKLLEIYRRVGNRGEYGRVQAEFNKRFNAYAPAWEVDMQQGHPLADYPGVIERVQALWSTPVQAMGVLEKSLTRPEEGGETFDLPAYRELLFLYAVARDLAERDPHERASVDLLLPVVDVDGGEPREVRADFTDMEPLMATRPVKAMASALPPIDLDLQLEDLEAPVDTARH
jgi:pilus assembly protein FimV